MKKKRRTEQAGYIPPEPISDSTPAKDEDIPKDFEDIGINVGKYAAMYKKAKESGRLKRRTQRIFSWGVDGHELIGKIIDIVPFDKGKFQGECNQYIMETDQGNVSFILGTYTDAQLEGEAIVNKVVRVEFLDKKELEDGRSVNNFDVSVLEE